MGAQFHQHFELRWGRAERLGTAVGGCWVLLWVGLAGSVGAFVRCRSDVT